MAKKMEEFTHEDFIRVLEMEDKLKGKVTPQTLAREEAEREKRLLEAHARAKERARGLVKGAKAEPMEAFSHEEYVQALKMQGKDAAITPETLALEEKRMEQRRMMLEQVGYRADPGGLNRAQQWERDHEQEEASEEQELRSQQKAQPPPPAEPAPQEPPPAEVDVSALVAEAQKAVSQRAAAGVENRLLRGEGHAQARNHCLAVVGPGADDGAAAVASLRSGGCAVTVCPDLAEARAVLATHLEQTEPQGFALSLLIDLHSCPDPAALRDFVAWAQRPTPASAPPAVTIVCTASAKQGIPPEALDTLRGLHRPPHALATPCWETAVRFLQGAQKDVSLEEEVAVLANLVPSSRERGAGQVIAKGKDHDLRMPGASVRDVVWLEVGMHWRGCFDLDLSCILLSAVGAKVNIVFFANLQYGDGAFSHSGDIMTAPRGDKECIAVDLRRVPQEVRVMYFVINSYGGEPFMQVEKLDASVTVGDGGERAVFAQFDLSGGGTHCALVLCRVYRTGEGSWGVTKVDKPHPKAETARALVYTCQSNYQTHPPPQWGSVAGL